MKSSDLVRRAGIAFIAGGALQIFASLFHGDNNDPNVTLGAFWVPVQLALLVFYALACVGLVGLDRAQRNKAGKLGLVGFVLATVGSALSIITSVGFAFLLPAAARLSPKPVFALLDPAGPFAWLALVTFTYILLFVPGFILTGVAIIRARIFPRWAGALIALGILVSFIGASPGGFSVLRAVGGVVFAVGLIGVGNAMWKGSRV